MNTRKIRAGNDWFVLQQELARHGVKASSSQLTGSLAQFVMHENLVPVLVRRAQRPKKQQGLFL